MRASPPEVASIPRVKAKNAFTSNSPALVRAKRARMHFSYEKKHMHSGENACAKVFSYVRETLKKNIKGEKRKS